MATQTTQDINVQVIDEARAQELVGGFFLTANIPGSGQQTLLVDAGEAQSVSLTQVLEALMGDGALGEGVVAVAHNGRVTTDPDNVQVQPGDRVAATRARTNG